MDGAALIPMDLAGRGVWKPHQGEVDGPRRRRRGRSAGHHACGNNRGPGWRDSVGTFGCPAGGTVADGVVKSGTEWLGAGPGRH